MEPASAHANRSILIVLASLCGGNCVAPTRGYDVPQFSIHRGKLLGVLFHAVLDRIGASRLHTDHRLLDLEERQGIVTAIFESRSGERFEAAGDGLIGADGIHSRVRAIFCPDEGPPRWSGTMFCWSGIMLWRGATSCPVHQDYAGVLEHRSNAGRLSRPFPPLIP
jgi:2-polyprenyl-6-methoxyphenol hydroxylase-like FAD-dependent oxidoreductase